MLRTLEDGRLDVRSVDELCAQSPSDLGEWIYQRLHGADTEVPDDRHTSVGQYYLVGTIYPDLQPETQAEVRRILHRFLRQLERGDEEWEGRPGDDLLLLVMQIGESNLAPPIKRMAKQGIFLQQDFLQQDRRDEQRHARLVQTLAHLGEKMTPAFWEAQVPHDPVLAFSGMQLHSLYSAFGLLADLDLQDTDLRVELYSAIRGLLASSYTHEDLRTALDDMQEQTVLPPEAVALVKLALPEVWEAPSTGRYDEAMNELNRLGYNRQPARLVFA